MDLLLFINSGDCLIPFPVFDFPFIVILNWCFSSKRPDYSDHLRLLTQQWVCELNVREWIYFNLIIAVTV